MTLNITSIANQFLQQQDSPPKEPRSILPHKRESPMGTTTTKVVKCTPAVTRENDVSIIYSNTQRTNVVTSCVSSSPPYTPSPVGDAALPCSSPSAYSGVSCTQESIIGVSAGVNFIVISN